VGHPVSQVLQRGSEETRDLAASPWLLADRVNTCSSKLLTLSSDFRINIKECLNAVSQLGFDFFFASFKHVHGDSGGASVLKFNRSVSDRLDFARRQQPHAIYECQIRHLASVASELR